MYKALPCVLQLERYSHVNRFQQIFCLIKYSGCYFCSYVVKSVLSGAQLHAD